MDTEIRKIEFDERMRERELALKEKEFGRAKWSQPLTLAILAAVLTVLGNIVASNINARNQIQLEKTKAENQITADRQKSREQFFLDIVKAPDRETSSSNLQFFVDIGVLTEKDFPGIEKALEEIAAGERLSPVLPPAETVSAEPPCDLSIGATGTVLANLEKSAFAQGTEEMVRLAISQIGICEVPGSESNPAIIQYFAEGGFEHFTTDEIPWVAAFANWVVMKSGYKGTGSATARSFLTWGRPADSAVPGAIVVLWAGSPSSQTGFVGFYLGEADAENIWVLGGNVRNAVQATTYAKKRVLGYRLP